MQRQIQHPLQGKQRLLHHSRLVNLRQAFIHIQNMGALIFLGNALFDKIVNILFPQGGFHQLFAGGVDPLAYNNRLFAQLHRLGIAAYQGAGAGVCTTAGMSLTRWIIFAICAGVVPQQPPR